jgi:diguanylate cyclase (GGDEF)-like protein/PAS domain S-box-containing protein
MHNFINTPAGEVTSRGIESSAGAVVAAGMAGSASSHATVEVSESADRAAALTPQPYAQAMVDSSPIASIITDSSDVVTFVNGAAEVLLGVSLAECCTRPLAELLDNQRSLAVAQPGGLLGAGQLLGEQTLVVPRVEGSLRLRISHQPLYQLGDCCGAIWSLHPLENEAGVDFANTEHHAEQRYESLFQNAVLPQFVLDIRAAYRWICHYRVYTLQALGDLLEESPELIREISGQVQVQECNESARRLLGGWRDQLSLRDNRSLSTDTQLCQVAQLAIAVLQGKKQLEYAYDHVDASGLRYNMLALCALPPVAKIEDGVLVSSLDITELTEVQADMHTRERFLSATLLALPDLLVVYDFEEDKPIFTNAALARLLGYDWAYIESLGSRFTAELIHSDDRLADSVIQRQRAEMARGDIVERPLRVRHANGEWKAFQSRSAALESRQGFCRIGVMVARDVTEQARARAQIDQQEQRYKLLAENFSDIICTTDDNLNVSYISPSVEGVLGYRMKELGPKRLQLLRRNVGFNEMYRTLARDVSKVRRSHRHNLAKGVDYQRVFELELSHKNRCIVSLEVQCSLMWDEVGELRGLLLVCRDVTQRAQLEADRRLAAKVFENSNEGIFITDGEGRINQINRAFTELTGYRQQDVLGQRPSLLGSKANTVGFCATIKPVLDGSGFWQGELLGRRKNGSEFYTAVGISAVTGKRGEFLGYISSFEDITETKHTEDRIRKLAYYDPLTGLPNRSLFHDRLACELRRAQRNDSHVALLFLDLDRFKSVNDSMGHAAGDLLLVRVAERLGACVRGQDSIARMGGDEFTIILGDLADRVQAVAAAVSVAQKVLQVFEEAVALLHGREVFLTSSIGIAIYPDDADDANALLQNADVAMYNAKQAGKNNFQFYLSAMNARALEKLELQNGLYRAAVNHDFRAMYQPIVDLRTGTVIGVETLLRWNHPVRGPVDPTEFVPVAEESGLIVPIGQWVLQEACQQMACWIGAGHELQWIAVNISARQFAEDQLQQHVISALEDNGLPAHYLELELTESILMDNVGYTMEVLNHLKSMGVELAIDDFGTGYSSLSYLKQFPIDRLKIDRAFVKGLASDEEDQRIAQAIVAIAHSFKLSVVAEGVEEQAQEDILSGLGCEFVQGYLYGRPMNAASLTRLLEQQRTRLSV